MLLRALASILLLTAHQALAQASPFEEDSTSILVQGLAHSMSAFWGDYDGDTDLDLLVANTLEEDMLFRNELRGDQPQAGHFTPFTLTVLNLPPGAVNGGGWVDIDGDGDLDLATTSIYGAALLRNVGEGDVPFEELPSILDGYTNVRDLVPADYDLDGDVDLVMLRRHDYGNELLANDGTGVLSISESPISNANDDVASGCWASIDQDLYPELYVVNVTPDRNRFYGNNQGELFEMVDSPATPDSLGSQSCAWGDYDGDGDLDLFVGKEYSYSGIPNPQPLASQLFRNDDGEFVQVEVEPLTTDIRRSIGSAWGDVDNDGDLDLVVSRHDAPETLYVNDGQGGFGAVELGLASDGRSMGVSLVDDDEDGDLDLFIANGGPRTDLPPERNRLFRNTTDQDSTRHWLQVDLRGNPSDAFGVGARMRAYVTIDGTPRVLIRDMAARPWRLAQDGFRAHFGLGDATWVDSLVVDWPLSGRKAIVGLAADSIYHIPEQPEVTAPEPSPAPTAASLRVAPNPSPGTFSATASGLASGPVRIEVIDAVGRLVATVDAAALAGTAMITLPGTGMPPGVYFVRVVDSVGAVATAAVTIR